MSAPLRPDFKGPCNVTPASSGLQLRKDVGHGMPKGRFSELAQRLPLGCCIKALTGDLDVGGKAAFSLVFVALGLRISRLLRFCDLTISGCSFLVLSGGQGPARFWPARADGFSIMF